MAFCMPIYATRMPKVSKPLTELTADASCAHFLSRYGSEQYYKYNKELLISERQIEILKEIEDLDLN